MEVILLEHVNKLGRMGDKVNVKNGYARNYLLPTKKALRATAENLAFYEKQKAELEAHNKALFESASKLYGSVTIRDIASAMKEAGVNVERRYINLERPIKDLGVYQVKLSLHPEVSQTILVNVARTDDEAKKQENAFNKE